jgi:hypothetical protein
MTTETPQESGHQEDAAERFAGASYKYIQDRDMDLYDSVQILAYLAGDHVDVGLYTRPEPSSVADDAADTQADPQRRHAARRLPQGHLHEDVDFYVINANEWNDIDPVMIELDARMAESFGQFELAAVARAWIH